MTIKELRTETGMTQQEFADYLDTSKRNIENWEYGTPECKDYILNLIEDKLINDGLISTSEFDGLSRQTLRAIDNAMSGKKAVALKRYALRCGASYDDGNIPAVYENTTDIEACVDDLMLGSDWSDFDDEEIENQRKYYLSRASVENGCVVIDDID